MKKVDEAIKPQTATPPNLSDWLYRQAPNKPLVGLEKARRLVKKVLEDDVQ